MAVEVEMFPAIDEDSGQPNKGPYTPKRGRFRGQRFESMGAYQKALRELKEQTGEETKDKQPRGKTSYLQGIASIIDIANLVVYYVSEPDMLNEKESGMLATAVDNYQKTDVRAARICKRLAQASGGLGLFGVAVIIALPRLERRGMLPTKLASKLKEMSERQAPEPEPVLHANGVVWANTNPVPGVNW